MEYAGQPGFMGAPEYFRDGVQIDPNKLEKGNEAVLRLGFQNASFAHIIPGRSTMVIIDLGDKLECLGSAGTTMDGHFDYELTENNGTRQIVCTQNDNDIEPGFYGMFEFNVKPDFVGTSSVVANILLVNLDPDRKCSDPIDGDNSTNAQYTVI